MGAYREADQGHSVTRTGITVRVDHLEAVDRNLRRFGVRLSDLDFTRIARHGMRLAALFAPKGPTGKLKRSIRANKAKNKAVIRAGSAAVPYAGPINYGWPARNIEASHFMQKADTVLRRTAPKELEQQLRRILSQQGLNR